MKKYPHYISDIEAQKSTANYTIRKINLKIKVSAEKNKNIAYVQSDKDRCFSS